VLDTGMDDSEWSIRIGSFVQLHLLSLGTLFAKSRQHNIYLDSPPPKYRHAYQPRSPIFEGRQPHGSLEPSENTETCELHTMCPSCRKSFIGSNDLEWPMVDCADIDLARGRKGFMLHNSVLALKLSVDQYCHFCTLVWEALFHDMEKRPHFPTILAAILQDENTPILLVPRNSILEDEVNKTFVVHCATPMKTNGKRTHKIIISKLVIVRADQDIHGKSNFEGHYDNVRVHPAQRYINTSSPEHARLIKYWSDKCYATHQVCQKAQNFVPTRLIVLSEDITQVRLCVTKGNEKAGHYIALSHCWALAGDIPTRTSSTLRTFTEFIKVDDFPRTFRHAITITRNLGVRFL
jgi:hypothetical protein